MRKKALCASEASGENSIYDCGKCMRIQGDNYRRKNGCRRINPDAIADTSIIILENIRFDYCPGFLVDSPYVCSVYELERFVRAGLNFGNVLDIPYPIADSLAMLSYARDLERTIRLKQEAKNAC